MLLRFRFNLDMLNKDFADGIILIQTSGTSASFAAAVPFSILAE